MCGVLPATLPPTHQCQCCPPSGAEPRPSVPWRPGLSVTSAILQAELQSAKCRPTRHTINRQTSLCIVSRRWDSEPRDHVPPQTRVSMLVCLNYPVSIRACLVSDSSRGVWPQIIFEWLPRQIFFCCDHNPPSVQSRVLLIRDHKRDRAEIFIFKTASHPHNSAGTSSNCWSCNIFMPWP